MKLGRNLARTFLDYYKLTGFISSKPSSSSLPKAGTLRPRDRRDRGEPLMTSVERSPPDPMGRTSSTYTEGVPCPAR